MIKNIIFDIGGVVFDDKNNNLVNKFGITKERAKEITNIAFAGNFTECMLGNVSVEDYIAEMVKRYPEIKDELEYILTPELYHETFPLIKETYEIIKELYSKGYNLYVLSNNTEASYTYVSQNIDMNYFKGVLSSYVEHIIKPNPAIYDLILERYNLNKEECIFIDDSQKNVDAANAIGIKSIVFKTPQDIIAALEQEIERKL